MLTWALMHWLSGLASIPYGGVLLLVVVTVVGDVAIFFFLAVAARGWPEEFS